MRRKILIVEDDPVILQLLQDSLNAHGYESAKASGADEAMRVIETFQPAIVLTDHDMPGISGLEMLRQLRSQLNYVSVMFISARDDMSVITQALRSGADDFIRKPFRMEELMARIEACLRTHDLHRELMVANQKLQDIVEHDHLTGLYNMRSMYDRIDAEIKRSTRYRRQMAVLMIDMDHFKKVNDNHDHLFGSFVLKEMGQIIKQAVRGSDFAARYGGDEFLIVLTETDIEGTKTLANRIRERVEAHTFVDGTSKINLTVSIGISILNLAKPEDARSMVRQADHALYRAKNLGRNCLST